MQTPAEKLLIKTLIDLLQKCGEKAGHVPVLLNVGAGSSLVIEKAISKPGMPFLCDRVEIEDVTVSGDSLRDCYRCSVESMDPVRSDEYDAVFANYMLEHVRYPDKAAAEICRVLKPGGIFVTSIPNPSAPEIMVARHTPLWFHKLVTGTDAWETHYAFKNINDLSMIFRDKGLITTEIFYRSCLESYMERFLILRELFMLYDAFLNKLKIKGLMNNVCMVFKKDMTLRPQ